MVVRSSTSDIALQKKKIPSKQHLSPQHLGQVGFSFFDIICGSHRSARTHHAPHGAEMAAELTGRETLSAPCALKHPCGSGSCARQITPICGGFNMRASIAVGMSYEQVAQGSAMIRGVQHQRVCFLTLIFFHLQTSGLFWSKK